MCPPRSIRCTKFNSLATRTKMFTMGPKTQRNLFFSSKTIEKCILATPPVSLLYKKTCRWIADWVLWPVRKISQPIHVQWIRRPDYYEKILRYRKSIGLPPGQKCSRWVPRDTTESLFLQQDCWEKYTSHSVSLVSLLKNCFIYDGSDNPRDIKQNLSSQKSKGCHQKAC